MSSVQKVVTNVKSKESQLAKITLSKFVTQINSELERYFDKEIKNAFGVSKKEKVLSTHIWKHIKEHNLRPAKRLRGSFVYYGYQLLGGKNKKEALKAAMSVELIHTALLMHDDFMDQDETRRGLATTHEYYRNFHINSKFKFDSQHYGESMAVNVGDIALLAGHELIGSTLFPPENKLKAINRTFRGILNTAVGQAYDVTLEAKGDATSQDIFDLHHAKTAIYTYENPLHIGAILANATDKDLNIISQYAIPGGIAFQLQDDALGLFGNPEKTGKPAHSDLKQGKMTLLILYALQNGTLEQVKRLKEIWGKRDLTENEAQEAREIVRDTGSLEYSRNVSVKWAKNAQKAIPLMQKRKWDKNAIEYLNGIAQYMIERDL